VLISSSEQRGNRYINVEHEGLPKAEARVRSKAINGGKIAINCRLTKLQASLAHRRVATNKKRETL
jgi:hypothetical protein